MAKHYVVRLKNPLRWAYVKHDGNHKTAYEAAKNKFGDSLAAFEPSPVKKLKPNREIHHMSTSTHKAAAILAKQRARKLSPHKRRAIASKAAKARWRRKGVQMGLKDKDPHQAAHDATMQALRVSRDYGKFGSEAEGHSLKRNHEAAAKSHDKAAEVYNNSIKAHMRAADSYHRIGNDGEDGPTMGNVHSAYAQGSLRSARAHRYAATIHRRAMSTKMSLNSQYDYQEE